MRYYVTGAAGHLGTAIVNELARKVPASDIQLGVYDISAESPFVGRGFDIGRVDYSDRNILTAAFYNEDVVIYIPAHDPDSYHAVRDLEHVIDACKRAGVKHIVTTGFIGDQAANPFSRSAYYGYVSRRLAEFNSIGWTLVREGVFTRTITRNFDRAIHDGAIVAPCEEGAISFVDIQDVAEAIADIVTDMDLLRSGRTYTLTQGKPTTMTELARLLTEVTGTEVAYRPMPLNDFERMCNKEFAASARKARGQKHLPAFDQNPGERFIGGVSAAERATGHGTVGHMFASEARAAALGMLSETSGDFKSITGRDPKSLEGSLRAAWNAKQRKQQAARPAEATVTD